MPVFRLFIIGCCLLVTTTLLASPNVTLVMPANDDACNATPLTIGGGCGDEPNILTAEATAQDGEPFILCNQDFNDTVAYNSVWFTFVAPAEEVFLLAAPELAETRTSYEMTVYTVNGDCADFANFTEEVCASPTIFFSAPTIRQTFTEGETYYVRVNGRTDVFGEESFTFNSPGCLTIDLTSSFVPANDNVCNAIALEVDSAAIDGFNINATVQDGEEAIAPPANNPLGLLPGGWAFGFPMLNNTVWYTFTTDNEGGNYTLNLLLDNFALPGNIDLQAAIYSAGDCNDFSTFTQVGAADNGFVPFLSSLGLHADVETFCLPPNTTYYVLIDGNPASFSGSGPAEGFFQLSVSKVAAEPLGISNRLIEGPTCAGESDGTIQLAPAGGTGDYTYLWSTGSTELDLVGSLAAGDYTLTITDECGITYSETISVPTTRNEALAVTATADEAAVCAGDEVQLSSTVTGGRAVAEERLYALGSTDIGVFTHETSVIDFPGQVSLVSDSATIDFRELEFVGEELYGVASDNKFYQIDQTDGTATLIDSLPIANVEDLSYLPKDDKLYVLARDSSLYEVAPQTGALTLATTVQLGSILEAAIDTSGRLIAFTFFGDVYSVDIATGVADSIGSGLNVGLFTLGLESDPTSGRLIFPSSSLIFQVFGAPSNTFSRFQELVTTGTVTAVDVANDLDDSFRIGAFAIKPGALPTFGYAWSPAAGLDDATAPSPTATPAVTTTYALAVTDACGVGASATVDVTVNPVDSVTLNVGVTAGDAYEGITINVDTTLLRMLTNGSGCDSIVTINVDAWPVSTQELFPAGAIALSPNPTGGELLVSTAGIPFNDTRVTIRDAFGRPVLQQALTNEQQTLHVGQLPAGQYYLEIRSPRRLGVRRFVKQ